MKKSILSIFVLFFAQSILQAQLPRLMVTSSKRFLKTDEGKPFFWQGDTAWELFHRLEKNETEKYLTKRAEQGFNVVQAVALAEIDGINTPNAEGESALLSVEPFQPNPAYFEHVKWVVELAESKGIYIALLPTWGDKLFKNSWGMGPEILNEENSHSYGKYLGNLFRNHKNIIWIIGGDRNPREEGTDVQVWNAMAKGVEAGIGSGYKSIMSFHPQPASPGGSSNWFHNEKWLDFNMHQTGHCANQPTYRKIQHDYNLTPTKPVLDGEPLYEDHPNCFNAKELGYSLPSDIRRIMYWNVFAGAFGQTYGCHDVWQMYDLDKEGINGPLRPWHQALDLPMANQMKHLKNLILSRTYFSRIPDLSMLTDTQKDNSSFVIATRDSKGSYAMIYFPTYKEVTLDLSSMQKKNLVAQWYDPRTGNSFPAFKCKYTPTLKVAPPVIENADWVLVIDVADANFPKPGVTIKR